MLSDEQVERYSRQILLSEVGGRGQERLLESSVRILVKDSLAESVETAAICGVHLAVAGVGRIGIDPESAGASHLFSDLDRAVTERTGDAHVESLGTGEDLFVSFGIPRDDGERSPAVVALLGGSRVAVRELAGGSRCRTCLTALGRVVEGDAPMPAASVPLLAAIAATSAIRMLLDASATPRALGFDLARAAPFEISSTRKGHECPAAPRNRT